MTSVCTDGQRIVSGSSDKTIRIWSCDTHELIGEPIDAGIYVYAVALSDKGHIATAAGFNVCIFDIETRQKAFSMKGHTDRVWTVAFSSDGSRVASGSEDKTVRIWDVQTGRQTHKLNGHQDHVFSVAFSSDGDWIASGSRDRTVRVWNTWTGQPANLLVTPGYTDYVTGVSFSTDNLYFISGGLICILSMTMPKPPQQITCIHLSREPTSSSEDRISLESCPVVSSCYSPDGSLYAASTLDGHVSIWSRGHKLLWESYIVIYPIHLLRLSETQLVLSAPDGSTLSWNLLDGKPTHDKAISRGPQLNASDLHQSTIHSNDTFSWIPFDFDAGLWAYVDGCLIGFEGEERSVTIVDLRDFSFAVLP